MNTYSRACIARCSRDGLKPVQRRILYAMYSSGNTHDKISVKVRKTVGDVIGTISSTWRLLSVRSNGPFKSRLEVTTCLKSESVGNNGSIDNDPPAAIGSAEAKDKVTS